jgi:hypothetical protein
VRSVTDTLLTTRARGTIMIRIRPEGRAAEAESHGRSPYAEFRPDAGKGVLGWCHRIGGAWPIAHSRPNINVYTNGEHALTLPVVSCGLTRQWESPFRASEVPTREEEDRR